MQLPLQVTFRDMAPSPAVEARVREKAQKLDRFSDHIMSCRVVIEIPHKHHHKGNLYRVRVLITVPEGELVADRSKPDHHESEDVYVAIRDAFKAVQRQLEDRVRVRRGKVKTHEAPPQGLIELIPRQDRHSRWTRRLLPPKQPDQCRLRRPAGGHARLLHRRDGRRRPSGDGGHRHFLSEGGLTPGGGPTFGPPGSSATPQPPPPGVSRRSRSPATVSSCTLGGSSTPL